MNKLEDIVIRKGEEKDISFIVETVIMAEKSFSDKLSYSTIFDLSHDEVVEKLAEIIKNDIPGQELSYSTYLIAEINGEYAGACCSWIEGVDGLESGVIKGNLLYQFFGRERILKAREYFPMLSKLNIERETGTLQIVNAYVVDKYRGRGVIGAIIHEHIRIKQEEYPGLAKVQLRPIKSNPNACRAYEKIGFVFQYEKTADDDGIKALLPSDTKVLMEKILVS